MNSNFVYHYLAFKYKNTLWQPFIQKLEPHLHALKGQKLLILGGSACACLPTSFLKSYKEVIIIEPDIFAPLFFKKNHPDINKKYFFQDAFSFDGKNLDTARTQEILEYHKPSAVLISNVVGQLPLYYPKFFKDKKHAAWSEQMTRILSKYSWMGFHDVVSYIGNQMTDHLTSEQKWPRKNVLLEWQITPKQKHRIEIVGSVEL